MKHVNGIFCTRNKLRLFAADNYRRFLQIASRVFSIAHENYSGFFPINEMACFGNTYVGLVAQSVMSATDILGHWDIHGLPASFETVD